MPTPEDIQAASLSVDSMFHPDQSVRTTVFVAQTNYGTDAVIIEGVATSIEAGQRMCDDRIQRVRTKSIGEWETATVRVDGMISMKRNVRFDPNPTALDGWQYVAAYYLEDV